MCRQVCLSPTSPKLNTFLAIYYHSLLQVTFTAMDFAPYQDTAPEHSRTLSPPRRSLSKSPTPKSPPPPFQRPSHLPDPNHFTANDSYQSGNFNDGGSFGNGDIEEGRGFVGGGGGQEGGGRSSVDLFETSLPLRLDYEAMMAYLLLPPAGGVLLLLFEHQSDYVRYGFPSRSSMQTDGSGTGIYIYGK